MSDSNKKNQGPQVQRTIKFCVFCRLDITSLLHVHCLETCCHNFDMCLHCFSLGMALEPHKVTHRYKLVDITSIPVFTDDWGADEELALLEAIEKCGLGNWTDIAAYVGKKSEHQCEEHYFNCYIFSPFSPLPDLTQPYPAGARVMLEQNKNNAIDLNTITFLPADGRQDGINSTYHTALVTNGAIGPGGKRGGVKKGGSSTAQSSIYERWYRCRLKQAHFEKQQEASRWKLQQMEFKSQTKNNLWSAVGYLPQRCDYEIEYLNDAEKDIAEMDFRPDDTVIERELKLRVLELYNHVLDERVERKEFIDRYQLLVKRDRRLTREEQQVYKSLRPFARYLEPEDFDELVRSIVVERSLRLRIEQLQTYRMNGIQTLQDGLQFDADYHEIMREWEAIHKRKWLDATTIPVGQYEALKNVLSELDDQLDAIDKNEDSNNNIEQGHNDLSFDEDGRPVVKYMNGYPTLSLSMATGSNTVNKGKQTTTSSTTTTTSTTNSQGTVNPFQQNLVTQAQIPTFFTANSTPTTTTEPQTEYYHKSVPVTPQQTRAANCPCAATGATSACTYNIKDFPHAAMLSQAEQYLCQELHLLPQHYLVIKDQILKEAIQNGYITQGTARNVLKVDVHVTDRVINFCISHNILPAGCP